MPIINDYIVKSFDEGIVTRVESESIPKGAASDSLNWLTEGDSIRLRRGMKALGTKNTGTGRITGLKKGTQFDGTEVLFRSYGRKLEYFDESSSDWVEIGSNTLPSDADDEDVAMDNYHSLAGAFLYASSPNSSIYKIPISNPGSVDDLSVTSHRGYIHIKQGRMFLWNRKDTDQVGDPTGLYLSYIDKDELSDFTEITGEVLASGDGSTKTFSGNLSEPNGSIKTCHYVRITDGTETFSDDRNGNLLGDKGGTGTINYATGAYEVTFNTAPASAADNITADYYWEDSTSSGIADFSYSGPRNAGEGAFFRQDDGGAEFKNLGSIGGDEFCLHDEKTWRLTLTEDDTNATNLIYRDLVGIPYWRAMTETGQGIPYLDEAGGRDPEVRILGYSSQSDQIIPKSLSQQLDLSDYDFSKAILFSWDKYLCLACQSLERSYNDTLFVRNRNWNSWDRLDYFVSTLASYNGALVSGDSIANNIYELFSGVDDDGSNIPNQWTSGKTNLEHDGVKKVHRMVVEGKIGEDQDIEVLVSLDGDAFVKKFTIEGDASYVASEENATVGSSVLGSEETGGGSAGISAAPFEIDFEIHTGKFTDIKVKFRATKLGWAEIEKYVLKDVRYKGRKRISSQTV